MCGALSQASDAEAAVAKAGREAKQVADAARTDAEAMVFRGREDNRVRMEAVQAKAAADVAAVKAEREAAEAALSEQLVRALDGTRQGVCVGEGGGSNHAVWSWVMCRKHQHCLTLMDCAYLR